MRSEPQGRRGWGPSPGARAECLFLRSEPRAGEGGGRPQGRRLADPTSAGARAVLKRPSRQSPGPARVGAVPNGSGWPLPIICVRLEAGGGDWSSYIGPRTYINNS